MPIRGVFRVCGWRGWRRNTKHKKHAISGAFFVFRDGGGWRTSQTQRTHPYGCVFPGLGGGDGVWRRNTKHEERAISGTFFMFRDGGEVENFPNTEEGMGVEVLGEGGDVSRHEKKRKKRRAYLVRPARCFPVPLWPLLAPPCVFHRVCRVFDVSQPPRLCCCAAVGGVILVVFQDCFSIPGASCGAFLH